MGMIYAIAVDNDYEVWRAFANHYWPALYFVDAESRIRHHRFGEGDYERSEMVIQQLVAAAGINGFPDGLVGVDPGGAEAAADWVDLRSPENYLGHDRTTNFEVSDRVSPGKPQVYAAPSRLGVNHWALSGDWTVKADAIAPNQPGGRIAYQFHARDLHDPVGALADLLASVINQNVTAWRSAPAAVAIKRTVIGWLAESSASPPLPLSEREVRPTAKPHCPSPATGYHPANSLRPRGVTQPTPCSGSTPGSDACWNPDR